MKEYLEKLIKSKNEKRSALEAKVNSTEDINEARALYTELGELRKEIDEAQKELDKINAEERKALEEANKQANQEVTSSEVRNSQDWTKVEERNLNSVYSQPEQSAEEVRKLNQVKEERGKALKEGRSITVANSEILLPKHQDHNLATVPFRQVSSFVDLTNNKPLNGGESYEAPFTKSYGVAGTTEEGADYTETEPQFDKVQINKVKITAYTEISEELEKLPNADYTAEVLKNIEISLKKKIAQQQIIGAGTSGNFVGIMSKVEANKCVLADDDLEISVIDDTTLDKILFSYGGDEEVEALGVLVLNKADLLAFSNVRDINGNKVYKVDLANQTINTVPYVINSNCKALSAEATAEGDYTMFYGIPSHYETAVFSPVEVMKSYDYKFKQGMVCFKASVFMGGNTTSYRGFMRIKKVAPTA